MSKVNEELWDLGRPLEANCQLQLLGFDSLEGRQVQTFAYFSSVLATFFLLKLQYNDSSV